MKRMSYGRPVMGGFTLIELMIVVAIVGILAAIAIPAYTGKVVKTRRTDAQGTLITYAQAAERYYSVNGRYTTTAAGNTCGVGAPANTAFYTFAIATDAAGATAGCAANAFVITATAVGSQASDGTLTLDNTNLKGGSVSGGKWAQ